jgi:hypothetical protein
MEAVGKKELSEALLLNKNKEKQQLRTTALLKCKIFHNRSYTVFL